MKPMIRICLSALLFSTSALRASGDCLEVAVEEMNDLYRTGCGCEDGVFNAISSSMVGWGVGLFVGIALLTGLVHNSHSDSKKNSENSK